MKLFAAHMTDRKQSRLLLHKALSLYTGIDQWEIGTQAFGKPYAVSHLPETPEVHFSISHSGNFWIIGLDAHPLGLDLQQHKGPCSPALAKRYFHLEELAYWQKNNEKRDIFYDIWCAKESYVKFTGEGITKKFSDFSIFHPPVPLYSLPFAKDYSLYLCSLKTPDIPPTIIWDW